MHRTLKYLENHRKKSCRWKNCVHQAFRSDQIRSVAQSCPTLCDPMNRSTPGLPVHHQLPEFTQTHVHRVGDALQSSHPLSSPSPPAPTISTSINSLPLNRCCISDKSLYYPAIIITPALILLARPPGKALQGIDDGMALRRESSIHGIL